jgi:hypothetical protein
MPTFKAFLHQTRDTLGLYWMLVRVIIPITVATEILARLGVIDAIAPAFGPVMALIGLPPELGLAWLSGILVGIWGAIPLIFALVPIDQLSVADVTVFSALLLFAHGLPVEQKVIAMAGPRMTVTTLLRIAGGLVYALLLHHLFSATGWLAQPVNPAWTPTAQTLAWPLFFWQLFVMMLWMLVILLVLSWGLELLKITGLLGLLMVALSPVLRLAGIKGEAGHLTAVGLFLGISYGGGLLVREARSGTVSARQVFLACVFMGFAHSIIEDTLIVVAIGADMISVLAGRLAFAVLATGLVALAIARLSDVTFYRWAHLHAALPVREGTASEPNAGL